MFRARSFFAALALGTAVLAAGCSDLPTAPQAGPEANNGLLGLPLNLLGSSNEVTVLERSTPLAEDESATQVIGYSGGTISLPEAGLTVTFPRGAVSSPTQITVTAPAGNLVGYHFEPHGIQFGESVTLTQDLLKTKAGLLGGLSLQGAYFEGDLQPKVDALELLPLSLLKRLLGIMEIHHFSGYVIATD